tara:strand:+ start:191 stop:349 length:159 start_codon:yes stop_codon:yes gene_type:complete
MWQNILKKKNVLSGAAEAAEPIALVIEPVKEVKEANIVVDAIKDEATPEVKR